MSLSQEIIEGTYEGVVRRLQLGEPIDILDEYGYTPLIHASATNRADIVELLLKKGARTDLVDISGSTALHWAVDNDNLKISQLLLKYGSNPNAYTNHGQPVLFYPMLRHNAELVKLLLSKGANMDYAKDFIMAKLIAHRFELQGNSDVVNAEGLFISIDLEGFYLEFTLDLVRDSLDHFIKSYVAHRMDIHPNELKIIINSFKNASKLREFKHFNKDVGANKELIYKLLDIELLLLPVSYKAHAITFVQYQDLFAKCDRGVQKMTDPIVINKIGNPKLLGKEFLINLLYQPHGEKYIKNNVNTILGLTPVAKLPIKHQITGNCSWANVESSVPTMLYILLKGKASTKEIMHFYKTWLEWDKDRAIEDCLIDFDKISFPRQKAKAALLGAVLFQACNPAKEEDLARAKKILQILSRKEFHYIVRIYANVFVRGQKSSYGKAFQQLIEKCGYKLSQFSN